MEARFMIAGAFDVLVKAGWTPIASDHPEDEVLWLPPKQPGMRGWTDATCYTTDQAFPIAMLGREGDNV